MRIFEIFKRNRAREIRLESALNTAQYRLESRLARTSIALDDTTDHPIWAKIVIKSIAEAREMNKNNKMDVGWQLLHCAEEVMIEDYSGEEILAEASTLRETATKFGGWRTKSIYKILGTPEHPNNNLKKTDIQKAMEIRNDFFSTRYHRIELRRGNLKVLTIILILGIFFFITVAVAHQICKTQNSIDWQNLLYCIIIGVLGSGTSMALTLTHKSIEERIPDEIIGSFVTWVRPCIGATAAIISYIVLQTKILDGILSPTLTTSKYGFLAIAFLAGFSERWIVSVVKLISNEQPKSEDKIQKETAI